MAKGLFVLRRSSRPTVSAQRLQLDRRLWQHQSGCQTPRTEVLPIPVLPTQTPIADPSPCSLRSWVPSSQHWSLSEAEPFCAASPSRARNLRHRRLQLWGAETRCRVCREGSSNGGGIAGRDAKAPALVSFRGRCPFSDYPSLLSKPVERKASGYRIEGSLLSLSSCCSWVECATPLRRLASRSYGSCSSSSCWHVLGITTVTSPLSLFGR